MGGYIAQELMLARPELVSQAVLMATRGRHDRTREFFRSAEASSPTPAFSCPRHTTRKSACWRAFHRRHSTTTLPSRDWIDMFTMWPVKPTPGLRPPARHLAHGNRLPAYRSIAAPVLVIGFADDLAVPPHLAKEVADAMPNGRYLEIADAGHLGFLERPDVVNAAILKFFADAPL